MLNRSPNFPSPHPGPMVAEQIEHLGVSISKAARLAGVTRQTLHGLIRDENPRSLSAELALRLEAAFGFSADLLLKLQQAHDLWKARQSVDVSNVTRLELVNA